MTVHAKDVSPHYPGASMLELFEQFTTQLNASVSAEVKRVPRSKQNDGDDSFVHHIYVSNHSEIGSTAIWDWVNYLRPAMLSMVNILKDLDMLEAESLPVGDPLSASRFTLVDTKGPIPVRFAESFDPIQQRSMLNIDFKVRHVGNYYRRIINGPLHRAMMPFRYIPIRGREFTYIHNPFSVPYTIPDTRGEDGHELPFLDLDSSYHSPQSKHRYKVKGDYCYYLGEDLV